MAPGAQELDTEDQCGGFKRWEEKWDDTMVQIRRDLAEAPLCVYMKRDRWRWGLGEQSSLGISEMGEVYMGGPMHTDGKESLYRTGIHGQLCTKMRLRH